MWRRIRRYIHVTCYHDVTLTDHLDLLSFCSYAFINFSLCHSVYTSIALGMFQVI